MCMMVKMIIKIVVIIAYMTVNWTMMLITFNDQENIYTKYTRYVNDGNILEAEEESRDMNMISGNKE